MKKTTTKYKGFTIIEVVLVLAIAGLIFLMVFIALPNLQRTQRDTNRRNDVDRVSAALIQYVANNNKLPNSVNDDGSNNKQNIVIGSTVDATTKDAWGKFYWNYLLAGGDDTFDDPNGGRYNLVAAKCIKSSDTFAIQGIDRSACENSIFKDSNENSPLSAKYNSTLTSTNADNPRYTMVVATNAMCGNEDTSVIVHAEGTRKFAVAIRLEGTGTYCVNN